MENVPQMVGVLATETLNDDMKRIFNITVQNRVHDADSNHVQYSKYLSDKAKKNLAKYFIEDFEKIDWLNKIGLLTEKQYRFLSDRNPDTGDHVPPPIDGAHNKTIIDYKARKLQYQFSNSIKSNIANFSVC